MLDPSYLRSIRDCILNGNIEANNLEALPEGLVGLYDKELFPPTSNWKQRKETLQFFLVFALAQKEISADFAAEILGDEWYNHADEITSKEEKRLQRVNELIQLHSKRFSSAGEGKFRLYHERFRVYILQKVAEKELKLLQKQLIVRLQKAIDTKLKDEFEYYALQHLSRHLQIEAFANSNGETLLNFVQDNKVWDRQIELSSSFKWSQEGLRNAINFGIKDQSESVIDCGLGLVELNNREQNDAESIIRMAANSEIELALARIEAFGGASKENMQRQFILYVFTLLKILKYETISELEKKAFSERILEHLKINIIVNHDLLDWDKFFAYELFFILTYNLKKINVDFSVLMERNFEFDSRWMSEYNVDNFSYDQLEFLITYASEIKDKFQRFRNLNELAKLFEKCQQFELLTKIKQILNEHDVNNINSNIGNKFDIMQSEIDFDDDFLFDLGLIDDDLIMRLETKKAFVKYQAGKDHDFDNILLGLLGKEQKVIENNWIIIGNISINYFKANKIENGIKLISLIPSNIMRSDLFKKAILELTNYNNKKAILAILELNTDNLWFDKEYLSEVKLSLSNQTNKRISATEGLDFQSQIDRYCQLLMDSDKTLFENILNKILNQLPDDMQIGEGLEILFTSFLEKLNYDNDIVLNEANWNDKILSIEEMFGKNSSYHKIEILVGIIQFEIKFGKLDIAAEKINRITYLLNEHPNQNIEILTCLLENYKSKKSFEKANEIVNEITIILNKIEPHEKMLCLKHLISILYDRNEIALANNFIENETDFELKIYIYENLIDHLCYQKSLNTAINVFDKLTSIKKQNILFEKVGLSKSLYNIRAKIFTEFGKTLVDDNIENSFDEFNKIAIYDDKLNFQKGMTLSMNENNSTKKNTVKMVFMLKDLNSLEQLYQSYVLNCLFFQDNYPQEKIEKFNKVLNIQWAIDIKNQLPN